MLLSVWIVRPLPPHKADVDPSSVPLEVFPLFSTCRFSSFTFGIDEQTRALLVRQWIQSPRQFPVLLRVFPSFSYVEMETRILKPVLVLLVVPKAPILCCALKRPC